MSQLGPPAAAAKRAIAPVSAALTSAFDALLATVQPVCGYLC